MKRIVLVLLFAFVFLSTGFTHAQQVSNSLTFTVNNPIPTLTSLNPVSAATGSTAINLLLNGTNFVPTTTATFNGVNHSFTFSSQTQGSILLTSAELLNPGSFPVCVSNPAPGGGASNCLTFQVTTTPTLASLAPSSCVIYGTCGTLGVTVTLTGTGFSASSVVQWNGIGLTTTFVSATSIKAFIPAANIAAAGTFNITVSNPQGTIVAHVVTISYGPSPTPGITGYKIYQNGKPITGTGLPPTQLTFDDNSVLAGGSYSYWATAFMVDANNVLTESGQSNTASVTVPTP